MKKLLLPLLLCSSLLFADRVETRLFSIENKTEDLVRVLVRTPANSGVAITSWYTTFFLLNGHQKINEFVKMINNDVGIKTDYYQITLSAGINSIFTPAKQETHTFKIQSRTNGIKCNITSGLKLSCNVT